MDRHAPAGFDSFYSQCYARIAAYTRQITHDQYEAEDITQEAFARCYAAWGTLQAPELAEGWVRVVAFRLAVSSRRRLAASLRWRNNAATERPSVDSVVEPVDAKAMLKALSRKDRRLLFLAYYLDYSLADIAAELQIPLGTAKSRLHRARASALSELTRRGYEPEDAIRPER